MAMFVSATIRPIQSKYLLRFATPCVIKKWPNAHIVQLKIATAASISLTSALPLLGERFLISGLLDFLNVRIRVRAGLKIDQRLI